jgi:hypothetical protein
MKPILICTFILLAGFSFGQRKIKVHEEKEKFSSGNNNALVVTIYESNPDDIDKAWKKLMKDYNAKVSSKSELFADDASIKDLSPNTVDVYSFSRKTGDDEFEIVVSVDLGGAYLSSSEHSSKYKVMEKILYDFAKSTTEDAIKQKQKEAEKILAAFIKEKEDLIRSNERLANQIEDYKDKIKKAEDDIEKNKGLATDKTKEIESQQKIVDEIIARAKAVN